ncbi:hypothetical protein KP509_37G004600 [Ceratopteris richardii]|uniref:UDP-N-acetylmuramoyl-L-alanyl-D-glutamate--2,6-diaminopimelate ligase MurE homolog, chloroplastic n=1 Tax=Ceratopteris richardii TaxID=49495 RepID=A0A8T2Q686_CERRI|nr:hypothetical protein KP509_37G004600 [Ceratopteris richardii]
MQASCYQRFEPLEISRPHCCAFFHTFRSSFYQVSFKDLSSQQFFRACFAMSSKEIPNPSEADPPEVEDFDEEAPDVTKFDRIWVKSQEARKKEEKYYQENRAVFREAIGLDPNGEDEDEDEDKIEGPEIISLEDREAASMSEDGDFFSAVDAAVASLKRRERAAKQGKGMLNKIDSEDIDKVKKEENTSSIPKRKGLVEVEAAEDAEGEELEDDREAEIDDDEDIQEEGIEEEDDVLTDPSFDLDFTLEEDLEQIKEPKFSMTLSELLDEARVVPILVDGDEDVEITGIQWDSRQVMPGNMFVCGIGTPSSSTENPPLTEAIEKGAVVVVASMEVSVQENVRTVLVEDTVTALSSLSAAFYRNPSKEMSVVGICGSNGKASTSFLVKSMFEAMEKKTGLISSIANYVFGKKKADITNPDLDAVSLHKLLATMVHNDAGACVMEVGEVSDSLNLDFNIAVFTNLMQLNDSAERMDEKHSHSISNLFAKMVDPKRHAKVVNLDDSYAPFVIAQGSADVPVITFSMNNRDADVFPLDVQLSLFETDMLVRTPRGNVEISSGLLGRSNVYCILAAVAVGIAINIPLEMIVQGIEEVDAVPGRCELIDEEQAFAVIVDHARTPDTLSRLLDTVRECGARRLITVVGCEGECERGKRPIMAKIASDKSEVSILTSNNPRNEDPLYILDDMLAGVGWTMKEYLEHGDRDYYPPLRNGNRLFLYDDRAIAVRAAVAMGEEGDAVVITGKGHEAFQLIGDKKEYLDDREECREALQHVDALHAAGIDTSEFPWRLPESH